MPGPPPFVRISRAQSQCYVPRYNGPWYQDLSLLRLPLQQMYGFITRFYILQYSNDSIDRPSCQLHSLSLLFLQLTAAMLSAFLHLRSPIASVLAMQQIDQSLSHFLLDEDKWGNCKELFSCFNIFVKISEQMQSESIPTLNWVIPYFLSMLRKLEKQE